MSESSDAYYVAYLREKKARREVEQLLEDSSRQLYEKNKLLEEQITQIKSQQQSMLQQEKLATLGSLAAGVAHEVNNPLAFVMSNVDTLYLYSRNMIDALNRSSISLSEDKEQLLVIQDDLPELVSDINEGLIRIRDITKNLLFFARNDSQHQVEVKLQDAIELNLKLLKPLLKDINVELDFTYNSSVLFTPNELNQLLVNILLNAIQSFIPDSERTAQINVSVSELNNKTVLKVTDTGCGMSDDIKNKVYDPFYTTKPVGTGTGMGMSMVLQVVQKHNCKIYIESAIDVGSTILIEFPPLD